uniref:ZP domain-containing protein n=1 Tax=Loa loa TaxID=7209 RepID=A0A1I7VRV3_LOALO
MHICKLAGETLIDSENTKGLTNCAVYSHHPCSTPEKECFPERLRLRFEPEEPFHGHIYVKGYFTHENCHLDFTRNPTVSPFDFNVLYKSPCVQKCETQEEPPNIFFHVNVIVQHHHLFLTQADSEYSVNCFYKREIESSAQEMKVNGLATKKLENRIVTKCTYEVLMNSTDGEPVKYASVGDRLIHKWSCESGDGSELKLLSPRISENCY